MSNGNLKFCQIYNQLTLLYSLRSELQLHGWHGNYSSKAAAVAIEEWILVELKLLYCAASSGHVLTLKQCYCLLSPKV